MNARLLAQIARETGDPTLIKLANALDAECDKEDREREAS